MTSHPDKTIEKDGFAYSYGRFCALPSFLAREESDSLRRMFLPTLSAEGRSRTRNGDTFVRANLMHYGVHFEEREMTGKGIALMKKMLLAGRCDRVPDHIVKLRDELQARWLESLEPEDFAEFPEWVNKKYFLSSGQPDRAKTTSVIAIPTHRLYEMYATDKIGEAAQKVPGLHHATATGPKTKTIFLGWDHDAVYEAARGHADAEAKQIEDAAQALDRKRQKQYRAYLDALKEKKIGPEGYSLVGKYIIRCPEIEMQWPDISKSLTLHIRRTKKPDIFVADFNFGVLEGAMVISSDKDTLEQHCVKLGYLDDGYDDDDEDEDEDDYKDDYDDYDEDVEDNEDDEEEGNDDRDADEPPLTGSKRKAGGQDAGQDVGHTLKKARAGSARRPTFFLRMRCRETGEGEIQPDAYKGCIKFSDETLVHFTAKASLPQVGGREPFSGTKISDVPGAAKHLWDEYL